MRIEEIQEEQVIQIHLKDQIHLQKDQVHLQKDQVQLEVQILMGHYQRNK
jgi:hypothetical protein